MSGKSPVAMCSVMRSRPCRRQSSVSVTTTALMHIFAWICSEMLRQFIMIMRDAGYLGSDSSQVHMLISASCHCHDA